MPAKPETTPPASAPVAAPAAGAAAASAPGTDSSKRSLSALLSSLVPVAIVLIATPVLTWAVAQFVLMPKLEKRLASVVAESGAPAKSSAPEAVSVEPKAGEPGAPTNTYEFSNVVVNLAGTMGTRYLKVSFLVTGTDTNLHNAFESSKAKLTDVTLNVLSSISLPDLDEAGAKNMIREKLVSAYNQALGKHIAEQVYFSDFVVQ
jgi:flagellar FliL protein